MPSLLRIKDLQIQFKQGQKLISIVQEINIEVETGQTIALVGESGCGKSTVAHAIIGLLPKKQEKNIQGQIWFEQDNLLNLPPGHINHIRGGKIGMIFQDPMTALNPLMTIGDQIIEGIRYHLGLTYKTARLQAIEMLELVGINMPEKRIDQYPHEFSGGMRQRVLIAIALACRPKLLIADEPTTALDVTIQDQILKLLQNLQKKMNMSIILITHDLGVVAAMCSKIFVMYGGKIVESGPIEQVFYAPMHPYTQGLLGSMPHLNTEKQKELIAIEGMPPHLENLPIGCSFHTRCPYAMEICAKPIRVFNANKEEQNASCWLHHPQAEAQKQIFLKAQKKICRNCN